MLRIVFVAPQTLLSTDSCKHRLFDIKSSTLEEKGHIILGLSLSRYTIDSELPTCTFMPTHCEGHLHITYLFTMV